MGLGPVCLNSCEPCDLSEISFENISMDESYNVITSFESEDLSGEQEDPWDRGRTVIGGMDMDKDEMQEILVTDYNEHRVILLEFQNGAFADSGLRQVIRTKRFDGETSPRTVGVSDLG